MSVVSFKQSSLANPVKYGSFLAGNDFTVPPALSDYDLLETEILASSQSSVTFDNLDTVAADYKHLQIRVVGRTDRSNNGDDLEVELNDIASSSYARHGLQGTGSSVVSYENSSESYTRLGRLTAATGNNDSFGAVILDILDFSDSSKNTTIRALSGFADNQTDIRLASGLLNNTSAITKIKFTPAAGINFVTGSRFSLYGLKETA